VERETLKVAPPTLEQLISAVALDKAHTSATLHGKRHSVVTACIFHNVPSGFPNCSITFHKSTTEKGTFFIV